MTEWATLHKLIEAQDPREVGAAMHGLDTAGRRALVDPLVAYERNARRDSTLWRRGPALAVAGAAVLPGAAPLAAWLARHRLRMWSDDITDEVGAELVMTALRDRAPTWLPNLMSRLAERLPVRDFDRARFLLVRALAAETGSAPPPSDGYVLTWLDEPRAARLLSVDSTFGGSRSAGSTSGSTSMGLLSMGSVSVGSATSRSTVAGTTLPAAMFPSDRAECGALLLRLFEVPGVGSFFDASHWWPEAFPALIAEGHVDRADVVAACVTRLGSPGRTSELAGYLRVFTALDLTANEIGTHAQELVAVTTMAPGRVANAALAALIRADRAGSLPPEIALSAVEAACTRTEKKLVRTALGWLDTLTARDPAARAGAALSVLAVAFGRQAADLQQRAVSSALRWIDHADPRARADLLAAARQLPADQRAELGADDGSAAPVPLPMPAYVPEEMPAPIVDAAELAVEIAVLRRQSREELDPVGVERVLAALVALGAVDRSGVRAALAPLFARDAYLPTELPAGSIDDPYRRLHHADELMLVVAAAQAPARGAFGAPYPGTDPTPGDRHWRALLRRPESTPLHEVYARRLRAIAVGVAHAPRPALLSTPTGANGLIDPAVLVDRLRRAAAEGWQPWPFDLEHALRRLPIAAEPELAAQARALGTAEGDRAALRLAAGHLPSADPTRAVRRSTDRGRFGHRIAEPMTATLAVVPTGSRLGLDTPEDWLVDGYDGDRSGRWAACLPSFLPNDRDLIAAHLVPQFAHRARVGRGDGRLLPMLAIADGPFGAGLALALAHGLNARDRTDRTHATDALAILAARGQLDGAFLGDLIGRSTAAGELAPTRIVPSLRELADAGAPKPVWDLLRAALPHTLAATPPPTRHADLLELAVHVADITAARGPIPGLPEAAGPGSSRSRTEARRLLHILTGP
ncbi:DUF6493 family protein [Embleya sp. NPDC050493]|uniref:DUF6493 family protein n=1 Tax=Embleya sp. NPDC050493 TaxID=3363989 RepID=UPI0037A6B803